jgi:hypothetical protein
MTAWFDKALILNPFSRMAMTLDNLSKNLKNGPFSPI